MYLHRVFGIPFNIVFIKVVDARVTLTLIYRDLPITSILLYPCFWLPIIEEYLIWFFLLNLYFWLAYLDSDIHIN